MYATYGSYRHDDNTCTVSEFMVRPMYSQRQRRYATAYRVTLNGQLIINDPSITDPATLQSQQNDKISALINAYKDNYKDFKFFHDDGTLSKHCLLNANSLTGVQVKHRSWPTGDAAEYATVRSYTIILEAMYDDLDVNSSGQITGELLEFREQYMWIGNGGPKWELSDTVFGPRFNPIYPSTQQRMIQVGTAIGWDGYPFVHMQPFAPQWEHQDRRVVRVDHPQRFAQGFRAFPLHWEMHFSFPSYTQGVPLPR